MSTVTAYHRGKLLFGALWVLGILVFIATGLGWLAACPGLEWLAACPGLGWLPPSPALIAAVVLVLCFSIAVGILSQRCGFFACPIVRAAGTPGRCALTFDDGPDPEFTPRVLEILARTGQRATFFVIGERAARHPELMQRLVAEGHEVGNHSATHPWHLSLWPGRRVAAELNQASDLIERACGVRPRLFRPPAGILSPRIAAGARAAGLQLVGFSTRSLDGSPVIPASVALRRLARGLGPGAILLLHDGAVAGKAPVSLSGLPELCAAMERAGLRSVPVSELIG